jgi:hypothetical protein
MSIKPSLGINLYKNNKPLQDLANIMEHPLFKDFFNTYFEDPQTAQSMLLLMKIYNNIDSSYLPYEKLEILFNLINDGSHRKKIVDKFSSWKNKKNNCISNE